MGNYFESDTEYIKKHLLEAMREITLRGSEEEAIEAAREALNRAIKELPNYD